MTDREDRAAFADALHRLGALRFGAFTLKDGSHSPVYCDLRLLISKPDVLRTAADLYARLLSELEFDRIAAIPHAGLPLGTAVALAMDRPMIFPRKSPKGYGRSREIEGRFEPGETAVVIDDLISSGSSKLEAIAPLEAAGLTVRDVVVLIDRRAAGSTSVEDAGYRVHAVYRLIDLAQDLADAGTMPPGELAGLQEYLHGGSG